MINSRPLQLFKEFAGGQLVKPRYEDYSFANLVPTIYYLLTGKKIGPLLPKDCFGKTYPHPQKLVLFFIDAFGFYSWQRYAKKFRALDRITSQGVVTPISALFPSTTASAVSTINLGVLPSRHALYEWNLYIEDYGEVIQTLPFCQLGKHPADQCLELGYDPKKLLDYQETFYQKLKVENIKSQQHVRKGIAESANNKLTSKEAGLAPFKTLAEGLTNLRNQLERVEVPTYFYFYWADIDSVLHRYGPETPQTEAEIANFWLTFEYVFGSFIKQDDTLFLFTADHGQVAADPTKTYYLNQKIPKIGKLLKKDKNGQTYPSGSARDVFLRVAEGRVEQAYRLLTRELNGTAEVMLIKDALQAGFFGPPPYGKEFLGRLGEILILPYGGKYVWWYEKDKMESKHLASHGGLTREEVTSVLGAF